MFYFRSVFITTVTVFAAVMLECIGLSWYFDKPLDAKYALIVGGVLSIILGFIIAPRYPKQERADRLRAFQREQIANQINRDWPFARSYVLGNSYSVDRIKGFIDFLEANETVHMQFFRRTGSEGYAEKYIDLKAFLILLLKDANYDPDGNSPVD